MHTRGFTLEGLLRHRDDFCFELPRLSRCMGPLLRNKPKLIDVLLGESVLLPEEFGPTELREGLGAHAILLEGLQLLSVLDQHRLAHGLPVACLEAIDDVGADGHCRHDLHTSSDDAVVHSTHDSLSSGVDCLLRGSTLAINGSAGHSLWERLGSQHNITPYVPRLGTDLAHAAKHDIFDLACVNLGPLHKGVADNSPQICWMVAGEFAIFLAACGPAGINYVSGEGLEITHCSKIERNLKGARSLRT
mmetsp:Transcript_63524/g.148122  ORF Transcript_63524/g.148122 Transcript_63524/m.148122 type:complete len:248 (+) Transcript_63524:671-1414(+)